MKLGIIMGALVLGLAAPARAGQADTSSMTRTQIEAQRSWERMLDRMQRERFHEDYEADRRVHDVNPPGHDAEGVEVDGDEDD
jgi:hypothetical protein